MADDYAALLGALRVDSALVLGWSDGGINGLLLAVTGANLRPDSTAVEPDVLRRVARTHTMFRALFKEPKPKTPLDSMVYKYVRLLREQPHISLAELHKIAAPTLVIGGDYDVIRPGHTLQIFENIGQAYLWIRPDSGHSTLIAYADAFNQTVDTFFKTPYRKIADRAQKF